MADLPSSPGPTTNDGRRPLDDVTFVEVPGADHGGVMLAIIDEALDWTQLHLR